MSVTEVDIKKACKAGDSSPSQKRKVGVGNINNNNNNNNNNNKSNNSCHHPLGLVIGQL